MKARSGPTAALFVALMAAGCANDGSLTSGLNTSSIDQPGANAQSAKSDPACLTLTAQIEALNRDGTADKVSKAAAKKYKLKTEDLAKADELNKANTEFQTKCSPYPPRPVVATTTTPATTTTTTTTTTTAPKKVAAKKTAPPVPTAKPPAATATATPAPATTTTTTSMPPQTAENPDPTFPQP
jgi:hypothetical protein